MRWIAFCVVCLGCSSAYAQWDLSLNKTAVAGQNYVQGTIALDAAATSPQVFTTYDNSSLVTTPASVTVATGTQSKIFGIQTTAVNSTINTTVYARQGTIVKSRPLALVPLIPTALAFVANPTFGGANVQGRVVMNGVAGPGGRKVSLYDNNVYATTPSSVTVPPGASFATFWIATRNVPSQQTVLVTAIVSAAGCQGTFRIKPVSVDQRIAFMSNRSGNAEVFVMNPDGSNPINLTNNPADDGEPAWNIDHSKIAFTRGNNIYTMNPDGSNQTVWSINGVFGNGRPAWSHLGALAWGYQDIFNGANQLTTDPASDSWAAFSPDGSKIAWTSAVGNKERIWVMNADGSDKVMLTNASENPQDYCPAWSPDGTQIAFSSARVAGGRQIYVINADGSNLRLLTGPGVKNDFRPVWSPDGTKIAFATDRDGNWEIYVMHADGLNPVNVTNHPGWDEYPSWR